MSLSDQVVEVGQETYDFRQMVGDCLETIQECLEILNPDYKELEKAEKSGGTESIRTEE